MTKLLSAGDQAGRGVPIAVSAHKRAGPAASEEPLSFTWEGQAHRIAEITRSWRVDIDWWQGRTWRAYFKVSTDSGLLVILYQDLLNGEWYLQRLYD